MPFQPYILRERSAYATTVDFWITNEVAEAWYHKETYPDFTEWLWCKQVIRPGFRIADCGAHHGMLTILMAKWTGESGHVTAFEILAENAAVVEKNAALNGLANVTVRPVGVGERNETVEIASQGSNAVVRHGIGETATLVRLDDEFAGQPLDFLKLDVEGSDLAALRGAAELLERTRPFIDLELHPFLYQDRTAETREILSLIDDRWSLLITDNQGPLQEIGRDELVPALAAMHNPHVLCTPRQRAR